MNPSAHSDEKKTEDRKVCPRCGEPLPPRSRICPRCGTCCCDPEFFRYPPKEEDREVYEKKYLPIAWAIVILSAVAVGCSLVLTLIHA